MKRRNDWLVRLNKVLADYQQGVEPSTINCARFADDAYKAMTGESLMGEFKGETIEEQLAELKKKGYDNPIEFLKANFEEIKKPYSSVGDLAVFRLKKNQPPAFGIIIGDIARVIRDDGKPGNIPLSRASKVFKL